ncbi:glycosyltransferase family 2 protein [Exiguobacterium aurantiacum]|uniref:glycosyltransferase family 2 protein n=1 Tax=Exiguobacterium aurantiacum TaxID=33987 RepID=UPI0008775844|nr:glycosyltransferase family 2 protein [Exiguobacterium aurantiacum]
MADLTTIILTYNEELNIEKCIKSISSISKRVIVVDSHSTDSTVEKAKKMGAEIYLNPFISHSSQFEFAIENCDINTAWILRLDADERLTETSRNELNSLCNKHESEKSITGIVLRFEVNFLGKKLRHGGIYPFRKLLVFKNGAGKIERRNMDEHIYLAYGKSIEMKSDSLHEDYKNLSRWISKHNNYSDKEVLDYKGELMTTNSKLHINAKFKRWTKVNIYYKLPLGIRPFIYFMYRFVLKKGFLDGKEGFIFAVLQAFWYRFLVDAKIYEDQKTNGVSK